MSSFFKFKTPVLIAVVAWSVAAILLVSDVVLYEIDSAELTTLETPAPFTGPSGIGGSPTAPELTGAPTPPPSPTSPTIPPPTNAPTTKAPTTKAPTTGSPTLSPNIITFAILEHQCVQVADGSAGGLWGTPEFTTFLTAKIASAFNAATSRVHIESITCGSLIVEYRVEGEGSTWLTVTENQADDIATEIRTAVSTTTYAAYAELSNVVIHSTGAGGVVHDENTASPTAAPTYVRQTIQIDGVGTVLTPNIIIILADDMGFGDVAANYDQSPHQAEWTQLKKGAWLSGPAGGGGGGCKGCCGGTRPPPEWTSNCANGKDTCDDGSQWTAGGAAEQDYPIYQTQHIDSLASPGILFNAMHSGSPVCTPTRASVLTGRLPGRDKIDYVDDTGKNQMQASAWEDDAGFGGGHTEGDSESTYCIPQEQYTIAHAARKKGYATAFYGKWHLGNLHNSKTFSKYDNTPIDYGFQHYHATTTNAATHDVTINPACRPFTNNPDGLGHYKGKYSGSYEHATTGYNAWSQSTDNLIVVRDEGEPFNDLATGQHTDGSGAGCQFPHSLADYNNGNCNNYYEEFSIQKSGNNIDKCENPMYSTVDSVGARGNSAEYLVDKAIEFIEEPTRGTATGAVPFFIELAMWHMHTPFLGSTSQHGTGSTNKDRYMNYKGTLQELDDAVGKLIAYLKEEGHHDNTIVIFTSDNGQEKGRVSGGSPGPYSGCKREIMEGGIRIPGLLQWPDVIKEFHHTKYPAATYDFLPTVEDLLSQLPDDPTYTAIANHRYKTNADWDGESWRNIIEHAARPGATPSPDHVAEARDRGKNLYIAAHKDGDESNPTNNDAWVFYSKSGQYKVYTKENRMVDLWADPREVFDLGGSSNNNIKNTLMSEYGVIKTSYENSRTDVKQNWQNGNTWKMCYGQDTNT